MAQVRVVLKSVWDDKAIKDAQKSLEGISDGITKTFKAIGVAALAAGAAIAKLSADSIKAASDLQESTNAVNVAFGDSADAILKIGESAATSLGLAQTEFNQAAVRFSAFAERIVGEGGDVAGFIQTITTRAADFASVFNIQVSEALQVFQSGLSGEAEPLKRFGINLLETEVKAYALRAGIIGVGESLTETQKVQARYGLLLESTNKVQGDFANTSDSLANRQRILKASFTDIQAEIGQAMLPALESLVGIVVDDLLPIFEEFGEKVGPAVADVLQFIAGVFDEAFTEGTNLNIAMKDLGDSFDLLFSAITGGKKDAEGFSNFLANISRIIEFLVTTMASLVAFFQGFGIAMDALSRGDFATFWKFLTTDTIEFMESVEGAKDEVDRLGNAGITAYNHLNELNNISLAKFRGQLGDTRIDGERLAKNAKELYYAMRGIDISATDPGANDPGGTKPKGESAFEKVRKFILDAQKDLATAQEKYNETVAKAQQSYIENILKTEAEFADRFADIVQQSQDRLRNAYRGAVEVNVGSLFETFKTAEEKRREEFEKTQKDLIDAQDKLVQADRELQETLAGPPVTRAQLERATKAYESAKAEFNKLNQIVAAGLTENNPVETLIDTLQRKLVDSRQLLSNSAALASAGFSQTFIEQIVAAGTQTGNELANAILKSTPEAQKQIKDLFIAIESEADSGMDSLAREIYEKAGLATNQLKNLYAQTQNDLVKALADIKTNFDNEILSANRTLIQAIESIRESFTANIDSMKGNLGGLDRTVEQFLARLRNAEAEARRVIAAGGIVPPSIPVDIPQQPTSQIPTADPVKEVVKEAAKGINVAAASVSDATGIIIDSMNDIAKVIAYLQDRVDAANKFANEAAIAGRTVEAMSAVNTRNFLREQIGILSSGSAGVGTIININVKTDSTQSLAMVGKSLGNTITKYVQTGGQVVVSPVG